MAAEEEVLEEEESSQGGGWRAVLIPMLTSAITAVLVGAGLYFFVLPKMKDKKEPVAESVSEVKTEDSAVADVPEEQEVDPLPSGKSVKHTGIYHNYDSFVVSIFDREKVHYLRIKVALELKAEKIADEIVAKDPQIKDSMIFVLGDFTVRELLDNQAKLLVKEVLLKTLNKILGKGKVIDVYFTEFVVQ